MLNLKLDHFLVGAADLKKAAEWFTMLSGITPVFGGVHPKLGTANYLVSLGSGCYLELIGPIPGEEPRGLGKALSEFQAPELFWFAVGSNELPGHAKELKALDMVPAGPFGGKRHSTEGVELTWDILEIGLHPFGGCLPFLIDWKNTPHPSATIQPAVSFVSFKVAHPQADHLQMIYRRLGLDVTIDTESSQLELTLDTPLGSMLLTGTGSMPWFQENKRGVLMSNDKYDDEYNAT
jgi:hypothetical protein